MPDVKELGSLGKAYVGALTLVEGTPDPVLPDYRMVLRLANPGGPTNALEIYTYLDKNILMTSPSDGYIAFVPNNPYGSHCMNIHTLHRRVTIGSGNAANRLNVYGNCSIGSSLWQGITIPGNSLCVESGLGVGTHDQFGSGFGVIGIANATVIPSTDPTDAGVMFVEGGALKYRGSAGTVTTIANA